MTSLRVARRADVAYRLAHPAGAVSGYTQPSRFFELPQQGDDTDGWTELLNRIFCDALMRARATRYQLSRGRQLHDGTGVRRDDAGLGRRGKA